MIARLTKSRARSCERFFRLQRLRTDEIAKIMRVDESVVANTLAHQREMRRMAEGKAA